LNAIRSGVVENCEAAIKVEEKTKVEREFVKADFFETSSHACSTTDAQVTNEPYRVLKCSKDYVSP